MRNIHTLRRRLESIVSACSFWALVLLALPACDLVFRLDSVPLPNLDAGPLNHISAIFCDIEKSRACPAVDPGTGQVLIPNGIPLSRAAVAFPEGETSNIGLDYSPDALTRCGGNPEVVTFQGSFPEGYPVCVNCLFAVGGKYPDTNAVCVAQCEDLNGGNSGDNPPAVVAYCQAHAHVSTNAPIDDCAVGACTPGGMLRSDFADPRRIPEPVAWTDIDGVTPSLTQEPFGIPVSSLQRTKVTSGPPATFDAGAASTQSITRGDAYVEFAAVENNLSHVCGLSETLSGADPSLQDINFGISLNVDGHYYVLEGGALRAGPDVNGSWGTYLAGERFRVSVTDNNDTAGTATIIYSKLLATCTNVACPETVFYTHDVVNNGAATYPFRVDTSFREQFATLTGVRIVRIK